VREKMRGERWITGCSPVPVELVGGYVRDGDQGKEFAGSQRLPAPEILAAV
jgi:hypothetical protein